jgi:pimeloyl-ACP methyl ester carboxylesterase
MGGLVVQILLARGLGALGVAIDSAAPKGIFVASWSFLKSNWPVIDPLVNADTPYLMSIEEFAYSWAHTLEPADQCKFYNRLVVPESRHIGRDAIGEDAAVDFKAKKAPLLLVAGGSDHIVPAALDKRTYDAYALAPSLTQYLEFPDRTHLTLSMNGWEDVADEARSWIERVDLRASA